MHLPSNKDLAEELGIARLAITPHPSNGSYENDSYIRQGSTIFRGAYLFRDIMAIRLKGKPLTVTEYGCVYWNKYRFEQPYSIGAYAAFQGGDPSREGTRSSADRKIQGCGPQ